MRIVVPHMPGNCLRCRDGSVDNGGFWCPRCCEDAALAEEAPLCPANLEGCQKFLFVHSNGNFAKLCSSCHKRLRLRA